MNNYVIIDADKLKLRIEELEKTNQIQRVDELENVLSQSTPLIPEIEKAYNAGKIHNDLSVAGFDNPQGRYISNLKLDI